MATIDTHDEWKGLNTPTKAELQEEVYREKAEAAKSVKRRAYRIYRRAGLSPWCSVRYMIQHWLSIV